MNNISNVKTDQDKHHRHSIRLKDYDYSNPGAYFVTICSHKSENIFGKISNGKVNLSKFGKVVKSVLLDLPKYYPDIRLDVFSIMPNHFHGVIFIVGAGLKPAPTGQRKRYPLSEIVRGFKTFSSRHINEIRNMPGIPVWQRNYYEHVVRNENKLNLIRQYILNNSLQWQYDRENPESVPDDNYNNQWGDFEEMLYEKKSQDGQDACQTNTKQVSQTFLSDTKNRTERNVCSTNNYRTGKMPVPPN